MVKNTLFPPSADLTPIVSSIASLNPDIVAVGGHEDVLINFVKASKSLNFTPKALIMHYGVTESDFAKALGGDAEGVFGLVVWTSDYDYSDNLFGTAKEYDQSYYDRWGSHPDYTGAACSAAGLVFQDAVAKLGKKPPLSDADREQLNSLIEQVDITTFYGPIKFDTSGDHYHDNTGPVPVLIQIQKGNVVSVGPAGAKKADMIYPLPAWNAR